MGGDYGNVAGSGVWVVFWSVLLDSEMENLLLLMRSGTRIAANVLAW